MEACGEGTMPWDFDRDAMEALHGADVVKGIMRDKQSRSVFMTNPETEWNVYICAEGMDPTKRPSKENQVMAITALVGDYDATLTEQNVGNAQKLKFPPTWIEQSLSGNYRCIWTFEQPLMVCDSNHARAVLEKLAGQVKMKKVGPALDKNSFNPAQTWTNGGAWLQVEGGKPLATDLLKGMAIECLKGLKGEFSDGGTVTDLKAMAAALAERYPKANEWPGDFEIGSQGPSFWVEGSQSPKSAIVKEWGMFTFADMASKAAWSWAELVGRDVAEGIVAKKMSDAASDIYYDGMKYFMRDAKRRWSPYPIDPLRRYLKIQHGLSATAGPEGFSQIDEALHTAEVVNKVSAVAPCVPFPEGTVEVQGKRFLNEWQDRSIIPSPQPVTEWGTEFPHIAEHISHVFQHPDAPSEPQAQRFLDWLSVFYRSVHTKQPQSGQAIFVLGGTGVGKGMLSGIIQTLVGGGTRAEEFLTGRSSFGGECYDQPVMCVDDMAGLETKREVMKFTENLKARVANAIGQNFHKKHQTPANIPWFGRIVVTMNDDDSSMSVLPDFSASVEDKISLFHAAPTKSGFAAMFATLHEKEEIIRKEAPFFARYLLEHYDRMEQEYRDPRYGTRAYHFSMLRAEVDDTQALGTLAEPVREFFESYFASNPDKQEWQGKASQLFREMQAGGIIGSGSAYPHANVNKLGRQLRREQSRDKSSVNGKTYPNSKESATWTIRSTYTERQINES
jgi:hypothetical protein